MELAQAEMVIKVLNEDLDHWGIEVREEYSGRSMYGASVPAFVGEQDSPEVLVGVAWGILFERSQNDQGQLDDLGDWTINELPVRTDNMGRGWVLY